MQIFCPCLDVFQPEMTFLFESGFKIKSFSVISNYDFEIILVKGSYQNTDAFCTGGLCLFSIAKTDGTFVTAASFTDEMKDKAALMF